MRHRFFFVLNLPTFSTIRYIYIKMCDERPSLHIKFERPSCWPELLSRYVNIGQKLAKTLLYVNETFPMLDMKA